MAGRPTSHDPRSRRSREQILAALHRLARAGELDTISSLSSAAGVTRATFYNHFDTIEEAAWFALVDSFDHYLAHDLDERRSGVAPEVVGIDSLRRIIVLLRAEQQLVRLGENYDDESGLPGLAGIVLTLTRRFRADAGVASTETTDAEDIYVSAGLYAVMAIGAKGVDDPGQVAATAYSFLPDWMRHPPL
ncbi:TetR/AcrR family transcriptional regulator [Herbiconiux daphne]|uniref:TetR/AcrR family transcriptional regulator n=1 Tax=Herbiconiux daphne TaxID=2970914 RepID=A0ABT2H1F4_9MICO|nr:TetR/AcrR family transcriptional regulator [Herbiconiux daphne]MCS5733749.1 TetR/AcrR family transcriptional regulator [Herbiconiux daphne]